MSSERTTDTRERAVRPLKANSKPMYALRVLAEASDPLYEEQVYARAKRFIHDHYTGWFHGPLRTLVDRGYAEVSGPRGGQRYTITDAGRAALDV